MQKMHEEDMKKMYENSKRLKDEVKYNPANLEELMDENPNVDSTKNVDGLKKEL